MLSFVVFETVVLRPENKEEERVAGNFKDKEQIY